MNEISSILTIGALGVLATSWLYSWIKSGRDAQAELDSMVVEVTSTRAALGPLERYARVGILDQRSQKVILIMMADLRNMEDQLFAGIENYLEGKVGFYLRDQGPR